MSSSSASFITSNLVLFLIARTPSIRYLVFSADIFLCLLEREPFFRTLGVAAGERAILQVRAGWIGGRGQEEGAGREGKTALMVIGAGSLY